MTAVEFLVEQLFELRNPTLNQIEIIEQSKEMEKENTDNKVIHFAEWLTKKHTLNLMALYEQFEEQFYNE